MTETVYRRFGPDHEHFFRPAGATHQRRRAHLATHRDHFPILVGHIEMEIGVRIDEVDPGNHTLDLNRQRTLELTKAVVCLDRCARPKRNDGQQGSVMSAASAPAFDVLHSRIILRVFRLRWRLRPRQRNSRPDPIPYSGSRRRWSLP